MKKKIIALAVACALLAIAAVGGTYAYFTDHDDAENVFTVGSVDIDLIESTLDRSEDDYDDQEILDDSETYEDYLADQGKDIVPGRVIMKNPYVVNNGKSAAYVRIRVMVDADLLDVLDIDVTNSNDFTYEVSGPDANGMIVGTFIYNEALEPGEMTQNNPISSFMIPTDLDQDAVVDYQDIENIIYVEADAIQAETFASAVEAFAAFDAQQ